MTLRVLLSRNDIRASRRELKRRGLSFVRPLVPPRLRNLLPYGWGGTGHDLKSWDVLQSAQFLDSNCNRNTTVLDLGSFGSEVAPIAARMGFRRVAGIDLDPRLKRMPRIPGVVYLRGDYLQLPLRSGSIGAVIAISAIEHGYRGEAIFSQVERVLMPGGYLLASFDYWPAKVNTSDTRMFGMDWTIFSETEVRAMLDSAEASGLLPVGPIDLGARDPVIRWAGRSYTFAWLALRKRSNTLPTEVPL